MPLTDKQKEQVEEMVRRMPGSLRSPHEIDTFMMGYEAGFEAGIDENAKMNVAAIESLGIVVNQLREIMSKNDL